MGLATPSSLCIQVRGFKTEGGHCIDKGSNAEGKGNLKIRLSVKEMMFECKNMHILLLTVICLVHFSYNTSYFLFVKDIEPIKKSF